MGGAHLRKARRALENLVALSRENRPMTAAELLAEAKVMKLVMKSPNQPEPEESDFVKRFAKDVRRYLKQALKNDAVR